LRTATKWQKPSAGAGIEAMHMLAQGAAKNIGARQPAAEELNSVAMPAFLVTPLLFAAVIFIATGPLISHRHL
jgi:hypothetical protein